MQPDCRVRNQNQNCDCWIISFIPTETVLAYMGLYQQLIWYKDGMW